MIDFTQFITPEIESAIRLLAVVFSLFHLIVGLILFMQVAGVNRMIHAPHGRLVTGLGLVHLLLLVIVLLFVIFY